MKDSQKILFVRFVRETGVEHQNDKREFSSDRRVFGNRFIPRDYVPMDKMVLDSRIISINLSRSSRGPGQSSRMIKRTIKNSFEEFRTTERTQQQNEHHRRRAAIPTMADCNFDHRNPSPAMNAALQ